MFSSKVSLGFLPARDNRFQEQFVLGFDVGDEIGVVVNGDNHNALTRVLQLVGMWIVVQGVAFFNMKHHVLKTDSSWFLEGLAFLRVPIDVFH
jgi:hypothetical protein